MELVDTNVLSELVRPRPDRGVLAWSALNRRFLFSVISLEEVIYGLTVRPSGRVARELLELLDAFAEILPITDAIARRCATLRAAQHQRGHTGTQADMLIAATAYEHGAVLVTRNVRDFTGCGVRVKNPFSG